MMKNLENKNNKTEKYMLFNWAETDKFSIKEYKLREEYNLQNKFLIMYSGSEVYRQAKENDFAFALNENQYDNFYSKIIYIYNNKNKIKQKEINAYNYLKNNYDREIILKKLVLKIEETING